VRLRWAPVRSLRGRATLAFGVVTLGLAAAMSAVVWLAVAQYLLTQREEATLSQTSTNALRLERRLEGTAAPVGEVLAQLPRATGSESLARSAGKWFATALTFGPEALPATLRETVLDGSAARQRFTTEDGVVRLAVGVPLTGGGAYFEVFSLEDVDRAVEVLGIALVIMTAVSPLPAMLLGRWATRPALRPLGALSAAASAMAGGDLRARIDPGGDADLAPIAASFNRTAEALEQRVRSDARFAADVSHELRTPLTTIVGAASLLEDYRDRLPAEGAESLDLLRGEVHHFERLVADLLEISRTDAGGGGVDLEPVRLADLVRHGLAPVQRDLLQVEPAAAAATVHLDKRRFERVLANLVENAETHGRGLRGVTVCLADDRIWVLVDDHGPGIPPGERARIFERFAHAPSAGRTDGQGSGLGLALVERHVRLLGGTVEVRDAPGGGAQFAVGLPRDALPMDAES
jgi:two-component system sensor histidine kinase MtrB